MAEEPRWGRRLEGIGHTIIAGFGVPGRAVAESLAARNMGFCVIELNAATVKRCALTGVQIIEGNVADEAILLKAGIRKAAALVLAVPDDRAVLEAVKHGRHLNPAAYIIARCRFMSAGMEANRRGASEVIVEEQVVAKEMVRLFEQKPV